MQISNSSNAEGLHKNGRSKTTCSSVVLTENPVRCENAEITIIRGITVATMMSSLFIALFAFVASSFRTRG
jgi:hypothetical protein